MKHYLILLYLISFSLCCRGQISFDTVSQIVELKHSSHPEWKFEIILNQIRFSNIEITVENKFGSYQIKSSEAKLRGPFKVTKSKGEWLLLQNKEVALQLRCKENGDSHLEFSMSSNHISNKWMVPIKRLSNEIFYGGGMQFSNYDSYNREYVHFSQENGIGRGGGHISKWTKIGGVNGKHSATYCPVSNFTSSKNRSFTIPGYGYNEINFTTSDIIITSLDEIFEITLGLKSKEAQLKAYNKPLPYELPNWSLGSIVGMQGGSETVNNHLADLIEGDVKINAIWIQDWVGKRKTKYGSRLNWTWQPDNQTYPELNLFIEQQNKRNIKVLGYINPFFAEEGKYTEIGLEKGYFLISDSDSNRVFDFGGMNGYMLDLHNEEAFQWMKQIIKTQLVERGFSGWMSDFAEWRPIPEDDEYRLEDLALHNEYPVLWNRLNFEVINEDDRELFFFNRSGGYQTNRYSSMMWLGDQMTDYTPEDGLLSVFDGYISSSHSGLPMVHSDAGGYTSVKKPIIRNVLRSEKLLKDWLLLETFTPVLRTHEGLLPKKNAQIYDHLEMVDFYSKCSQLHALLHPYFELMVSDRNSSGALYATYPEDAVRNKFPKSMQIGNDIIIAFGKMTNIGKEWTYLKLPQTNQKNESIHIYIRINSLPEKLIGESIHIFE